MQDSSRGGPESRPGLEYVLVGVLVALSLAIVAAGIAVYQLQRRSITEQANNQLASIADLKVRDLKGWREERLYDAGVVTRNPAFAKLVASATGGARSPSPELTAWMGRIQASMYDRVALVDSAGRLVASSPASAQPLPPLVRDRARDVMSTGRPAFVDFYNESDGSIRLGVLAPIVETGPSGRKLGALYLRADPATHLYPYIAQWPVPSDTAESLIVRREGDEALFLNPLRFDPNAALTARVPLKGDRLTPAATAVSGYQGPYRGFDYRGVDVMSALRRVPGTDWFLVARVDTTEALAPLRARIWQLMLLPAISLVLAAMGVGALQRRRDALYYRERLQAASERSWLLDVLAGSPNEIYVIDVASLRVTFANHSAAAGLGYVLDELRGRPFSDIQPGFAEATVASLVVESGSAHSATLSMDTIHRRQDGTSYPVAAEFRRMHTGTREVYLAIADDVTERAAAMEALRESAALLVESQRAAAIGHYVLHIDGGYWTSSEVLDELFGIEKASQRTVEEWLEVVHPDDRDAMAVYYQNHVLAEHNPFEREYRIQRLNDHAVRWVRGVGELSFDESGQPVTMFGVIQDITERKLAEIEVQRVHTELEQIVADRTAQLAAANRELEAFSYSVSHDLRAPLRHVSGFVELLGDRERDRLDEKSLHYVDVISDAVRQMGVLIDDLLLFSRVGRGEFTFDDVDMRELLDEALVPITHSATDRAIEWDIQELPHVHGDKGMLRLVWANLLGNAVKYTRPRAVAHIKVGALDEEGETVFFVQDDGVGFDMAYAGKLFGVFQRLHSASEFEGTGIGLANVNRVVTRHGGRAWAEAETGKGATFYFSIPTKKGR